MDKKTKRLRGVVEYLQNNQSADVKELAQFLTVSDMTIRRDLKILESQNIVKLLHGGAFINPDKNGGSIETDYSILSANALRIPEKMRIAEKAITLLNPNEAITIDTGSTMEFFSRLLPKEMNLNILCYSLNVLNELVKKENNQIFFAGGLFHERSLMFESPEGLSLIRRTRTNKAFISASGASSELGVTTKIHHERTIKEAIMESSQMKILLIDSSKFGRVQTNYFAAFEDFDIIITDTGISKEYTDIIRSQGIDLQIV
jgi:DeoR family deoxyribose operon repressor